MENKKMEFLEPCLERHFAGHKAALTRVLFNDKSDILATSSMDASVMLWYLKQAARCIRFDAHSAPVRDISWTPNGNLLASAGDDRSIKIWQPKVHDGISREFLAHDRTITSIDFNCNAFSLVTGSHDKTVKLWSVAKNGFISAFTAHTNWVRCARFSPNGELIASCSDDRTVRIFEPRSAECLHTISLERNKQSIPLQLAWHPTGQFIAVSFSCGSVRIYDAANWDLVQLYVVHKDAVNDLAFDCSGKFLLTASSDSTLKLLDLIEGKPIYTIKGHVSEVNSVTFSKDGKMFASAGADNKLLVWKSNLHAFDMEMFKMRQEQLKNDLDKGDEHSILIDPRQSEEYNSVDEQLQIQVSDIDFALDSEIANTICSSDDDLLTNISSTQSRDVDATMPNSQNNDNYWWSEIIYQINHIKSDICLLTSRVKALETAYAAKRKAC